MKTKIQSAANQHAVVPAMATDEQETINVRLTRAQVEQICQDLAGSLAGEIKVADGDNFAAVITAWRAASPTFIARMIRRAPDSRAEFREALRDGLDDDCDLLECLLSQLEVAHA